MVTYYGSKQWREDLIPGTMVSLVCHTEDNRVQSANSHDYDQVYIPRKGYVYAKIRKFILHKLFTHHWVGYPISSFGNQGLLPFRTDHIEWVGIRDILEPEKVATTSPFPNLISVPYPTWNQEYFHVNNRSYLGHTAAYSFRYDRNCEIQGRLTSGSFKLLNAIESGKTPEEVRALENHLLQIEFNKVNAIRIAAQRRIEMDLATQEIFKVQIQALFDSHAALENLPRYDVSLKLSLEVSLLSSLGSPAGAGTPSSGMWSVCPAEENLVENQTVQAANVDATTSQPADLNVGMTELYISPGTKPDNLQQLDSQDMTPNSRRPSIMSEHTTTNQRPQSSLGHIPASNQRNVVASYGNLNRAPSTAQELYQKVAEIDRKLEYANGVLKRTYDGGSREYIRTAEASTGHDIQRLLTERRDTIGVFMQDYENVVVTLPTTPPSYHPQLPTQPPAGL